LTETSDFEIRRRSRRVKENLSTALDGVFNIIHGEGGERE
jgi:hypothetical protein